MLCNSLIVLDSCFQIVIVHLFYLRGSSMVILNPLDWWALPVTLIPISLQHELVRVLYPVFIHAFMDLVAKGHIQEGELV